MHDIYALLCTAEAGNSTLPYPAGEVHAILVFTQAPSEHGAREACHQHLQFNGWRNEVIQRLKTVSEPPADLILTAAYDEALRDGSGSVIYDEPLSEEPTLELAPGQDH